MKKAKILIPAVAALVLSSAAAVTGTVAWFTANLKASTTSQNITVVKTLSNLNIEVKGDAAWGTAASGAIPDTKKNDTITHSGKLIDGSVDLLNGEGVKSPLVYQPVFEPDGETLKKPYFETWTASGSDKFLRATKYTIEFTKSFDGDASAEYGVFIDPTLLKPTIVTNNGDLKAEAALRVGIVCGEEAYVWAPYNEASADYHYVNATWIKTLTDNTKVNEAAKTEAALYTDANIVKSTDTIASTYTTGEEDLFLGKLTSGAATLTASVYTWFEGSEITNDHVIVANYGYTLGFNAVEKTAA